MANANFDTFLGIIKNAVVGKAHRIGLERRPSPIKRNIMKPDRKKARAPLMPNLSVNLMSDSSFEQKADLNQSKDKYLTQYLFISKKNIGCEWPSGHPDEIDFHYCGENKVEGKPYCPKHCAKAYIVTEKLKAEEAVA